MKLNDSFGKSNEFPPVTRLEWEARIREELNGGVYEKKMIWKPLEGFPVSPFYMAEDLEDLNYLDSLPGRFPYVRGSRQAGNPWKISQDISVTDVSTANRKAREAISKGAESIGLLFTDSPVASSILPDSDAFSRLLQDIPGHIPLHFVSGNYGITLFRWLKKNNHPDVLCGSMGIDPIGDFCLTGLHTEQVCNDLSALIRENRDDFPGVRMITVNARHIHNAGASLVQELAFGLAMGNEYLTALSGKGCDALSVSRRMQFQFAVGSNYFMEIAKLRAARYLWARIMEAWGASSPECLAMSVHSETSVWNKTLFDPYVNLLRTTTEAMSAILGGASSLRVAPYDASFRQNGDFSERLARNIQIILKEEAYFDKVADPGAGSYYIENLTDSMITEAWKLFLEVEGHGGFMNAFREGWIQEQVETIAAERDRNLAYRKDILVGTNQYPDLHEFLPGKEILFDLKEEKEALTRTEVKPLKLYRGASALEEIRIRTHQAGKRPGVFLLTYGNLTMRRARASFAGNFFACGGFEVIDNQGFSTPGEGIEACLKEKAEITVVCSSDEEYPVIVPGICKKLKNKSIVTVAGYPSNAVEQLKNAGVRYFIHLKSDMVETLEAIQNETGIMARF